MMNSKNVEILVDVKCSWKTVPPIYRLFVNDELFSERTWVWRGKYLEELINLSAEPGEYCIRCEVINSDAVINVSNMRVLSGPAEVNDLTIRINDENS
jgi:hypothetical protein